MWTRAIFSLMSRSAEGMGWIVGRYYKWLAMETEVGVDLLCLIVGNAVSFV